MEMKKLGGNRVGRATLGICSDSVEQRPGSVAERRGGAAIRRRQGLEESTVQASHRPLGQEHANRAEKGEKRSKHSEQRADLAAALRADLNNFESFFRDEP
jgi:hypothetical protein